MDPDVNIEEQIKIAQSLLNEDDVNISTSFLEDAFHLVFPVGRYQGKLKPEDVAFIRSARCNNVPEVEVTTAQLARMLNVTRRNIQHIVLGKTHKGV